MLKCTLQETFTILTQDLDKTVACSSICAKMCILDHRYLLVKLKWFRPPRSFPLPCNLKIMGLSLAKGYSASGYFHKEPSYFQLDKPGQLINEEKFQLNLKKSKNHLKEFFYFLTFPGTQKARVGTKQNTPIKKKQLQKNFKIEPYFFRKGGDNSALPPPSNFGCQIFFQKFSIWNGI